MYRYDQSNSGYSGQSYDRNIYEANLSTVNKLQRDFWNAKQVLRKKLGKKDEECVVESDSDIDAKLDLFNCVEKTCNDLVKLIDKYQNCICNLSRDESAMGRFLKEQGVLDKTPAGKLMSAMGKAQCINSQQRLDIRNSLSRLHHDVETFTCRAVADCLLTIKNMEDFRIKYRASLRWMQENAKKLDPEDIRKLEKFRKVQTEVRLNKKKYDQLKWAVCQKVDLLCASRTNLFSNVLVPYQNDLAVYWKTSTQVLAGVLENIKGHKHYEFKLLKDLNPLKAVNEETEDKHETSDDKLICLEEKVESQNLNGIDLQNNDGENEIIDNASLEEKNNGVNNVFDGLMDSSNDNFGGDFDKQWDAVFGEIKDDEKIDDTSKLGELNLAEDTSDDRTPSKTTRGEDEIISKGVEGYMPSQLLDLMSFNRNDLMTESNTAREGNTQDFLMNMTSSRDQQQVLNGMLPPSYDDSTMTGSSMEINSLNSSKRNLSTEKTCWYDLFAELDPLQNPDQLDMKNKPENKDNGAC